LILQNYFKGHEWVTLLEAEELGVLWQRVAKMPAANVHSAVYFVTSWLFRAGNEHLLKLLFVGVIVQVELTILELELALIG
jgi:hypothetical protein